MNDRRTPNERSIDTRRPYHPRAFLPWLLLERRDLLPQLTKADILVLAQLALNADHDTGRNAFLSQVKCAAATSLDRKTVRRALHRLAGQFGLIEQTGTRQNRGGEFGIYRLLRPGTTLGHDAPGSDPTLGHDAPDPGASCPPTLGHDAPRPEMIGPGSHDRGVPCSKSGSESTLGHDAPGSEADGPELPAWAADGVRARLDCEKGVFCVGIERRNGHLAFRCPWGRGHFCNVEHWADWLSELPQDADEALIEAGGEGING